MPDIVYTSGLSMPPALQSSSPFLTSAIVILLTLLSFFGATIFLGQEKPIPNYELVGKNAGDSIQDAKQRYFTNSRNILQQGLSKVGKGFQVLTPTGPMIVLRKEYTNEIKSHKHLSFARNIQKANFADLPGVRLMAGMGGFLFGAENLHIFASVVRIQLTQSLGKLTEGLSNETDLSLQEYFPPSKDWTKVVFYPVAVKLVARMSSYAFLGDTICRNDEWLDITGDYAVVGIDFIRTLRLWPTILRPVVQFFLPERRKMRQQELAAQRIVNKELDRRRHEAIEDEKAGRPMRIYNDALQWLQDENKKAKKRFDIASAQLGMGLGAIHTSSMALTRALFDLCDNPEWIQPLREEIVTLMQQEGGWKKTTLHKMKLMDSVLKESQRRNPVHFTIMTRIAEEDITLSHGVHIRKNDMVTVTTPETMMDPKVYPEPEKFIGDRFLKQRQIPGNENKLQYVTTNPDHIGFGHGEHACPGRFFAGNELKIALAHMLIKYDWKFAPGSFSRNFELAQDIIPDPTAEMMFRERKPEIQL